jgi:predicted amidohydrolase
MDNLRLSLCQMNAGPDVSANLRVAESAFAEAAAAGSQLLVLPENVWCRGSAREVRASAANSAEFHERLGALSAAHGVVAVWGGVPLLEDDTLFNAALVYDSDGKPLCKYRKIHLFQLFGGPQDIDETRQYHPGDATASFALAGWQIALSICYDLRFPELYRSAAGAHLMLCPANFTKRTGQAHWRVLARARAIENQCYFAAVGQCGEHAALRVQTHGHSLVADPWGDVLAESADEPECLHVELSAARICEVRKALPALRSIRSPVTWQSE